MSREQLNNASSKYKHLPDIHHGGGSDKFVTPSRLEDHSSRHLSRQTHPPQSNCGSGTVDLRHYSKKRQHQRFHTALPLIIYMDGICLVLHISSSCCGHCSDLVQIVSLRFQAVHLGAVIRDQLLRQRSARRAHETSTLTFLTVAGIVQVLSGRRYIIENSADSDIFDKSPCRV